MGTGPSSAKSTSLSRSGSGTDASLTYRPLLDMPGLEVCDWKSRYGGPALSAHFHREAQLTIVREGIRWFSIGPHNYRLGTGQFIIIPSGVPHRAVGHTQIATRSFDVFFDQSLNLSIGRHDIVIGGVFIDPAMHLDDIVYEVLEHIDRERIGLMPTALGKSLASELMPAVYEDHQQISEIAKSLSMSREGFIRKFQRNVGMTPHAYRIAGKACRARDRLRRGMPPAEAAYDAGFADQSHMGRAFLKLYGTTPGAFRRAWQV